MWKPIFTVSLFLSSCLGGDPIRPYPLLDESLATTSILNHSSYVHTFPDQQWYLDNIPFVDFPDKSTQDVYYYRTTVIKRHLKYTHQGYGWVFTEFIHPVAWAQEASDWIRFIPEVLSNLFKCIASKFQTIPVSAAHQILEARWLRNPQYTKDTIQLHTRAGVETQTGITYTHYLHRAFYEHAQVTGDTAFLASQLGGMIHTFGLWNVTIDNTTGLYHRTPLLDAQEYSLPGYLTGGPNGGPVEVWNSMSNNYSIIDNGPETYRPDFNAYMIAGAMAISQVASLSGDEALAQRWRMTAATIYKKMQHMLWNPDIQVWIDVVEGSNLECLGRQLVALFPYRFEVGTDDAYVRGLEATLNRDTFVTAFGPTTLDQQNAYYETLRNLTYSTPWNGQSWPFSTSVYLGTLARLARENRSTIANAAFFNQEMSTYTRTNYKDGNPYTAECHYPTFDKWSGDTSNHSENYFHSTYIDNIFTNMLGIIPTLDDRLELRPLVPTNWTYFAVESLPYHGSLLALLWDQSGSHYKSLNHTPGLSVYADGILIHNQPTLCPVNITLANSSQAVSKLASFPRYDNILANPNAPWGLPNVTTDYVFNGDGTTYDAYKTIDGLLWYDIVPDNRWTNNQSSMPFNTLNITLPRARSLTSISIAVLDDTARGGYLACPAFVTITTRSGTLLASRNPWTTCIPNALNTVMFDAANSTDPVQTDFLSITFCIQATLAVGISEMQLWVPSPAGPRYEAEDGLLGTLIGGFQGRATGTNATVQNNGVLLGDGGWVEIADVRNGVSQSAGRGSLAILGGGNGTVLVGLNYLRNQTVSMSGKKNITLKVEYLRGGNVVSIFQMTGRPFIDAIVVG